MSKLTQELYRLAVQNLTKSAFVAAGGGAPAAGMDPSQMPPGVDPSQMPPGVDPSQMPPGVDPSQVAPIDPAQVAPPAPPAPPSPPAGMAEEIRRVLKEEGVIKPRKAPMDETLASLSAKVDALMTFFNVPAPAAPEPQQAQSQAQSQAPVKSASIGRPSTRSMPAPAMTRPLADIIASLRQPH